MKENTEKNSRSKKKKKRETTRKDKIDQKETKQKWLSIEAEEPSVLLDFIVFATRLQQHMLEITWINGHQNKRIEPSQRNGRKNLTNMRNEHS